MGGALPQLFHCREKAVAFERSCALPLLPLAENPGLSPPGTMDPTMESKNGSPGQVFVVPEGIGHPFGIPGKLSSGQLQVLGDPKDSSMQELGGLHAFPAIEFSEKNVGAFVQVDDTQSQAAKDSLPQQLRQLGAKGGPLGGPIQPPPLKRPHLQTPTSIQSVGGKFEKIMDMTAEEEKDLKAELQLDFPSRSLE